MRFFNLGDVATETVKEEKQLTVVSRVQKRKAPAKKLTATVKNVVKKQVKTLDFSKEKVQNIDLDILERSWGERDATDKKPLMGIYHYELIHKLFDMFEKAGLTYDPWDMFAAKNSDKNGPGVSFNPALEEKYGENAVEAATIRRMFCNIRVTNFDEFDDNGNPKITTNMGVSFTQKGIQIGYGTMVHVCHNQQMLGASQYASTFGKDKVSVERMIQLVKSWIDKTSEMVKSDLNEMKRMQSIEVKPERLTLFLGNLLTTRVALDSSSEIIRSSREYAELPATYAMNGAQLNAYTERILENSIECRQQDRPFTVYDLYDSATNLYKPMKREQYDLGVEIPQMDFINVFPQNQIMRETLQKEFAY
jgi:hypothetical protein